MVPLQGSLASASMQLCSCSEGQSKWSANLAEVFLESALLIGEA